MGRSVATPSNAVATIYLDISGDVDHDTGEFDWEWFIDDIRDVIKERYGTFEDEDTWMGGEIRTILENGHARIAVSDYCGIVSVSLVPVEDHENHLAKNWCDRISNGFYSHMADRYPKTALIRQGTMSNGVSVYRPIEKMWQ